MRHRGLREALGRGLLGTGLAALGVVAWSTVAAAAPVLQGGEPMVDTTSVWPVLVPLVVAAGTVERAIELGWNYLEWILIRFARWSPADLKTPSYQGFKSGTSLLAGLVLGVLVANYGGLRLLTYLRPFVPGFLDAVPSEWDIIITGLVIGAGSKPAHDILVLITQIKNFAGNSALKQREQAAAALAEGVLRLGQLESARTVEVPGVGPVPVRGAQAREGAPPPPRGAVAERYAEVLHRSLFREMV